MAAIAPTPKPGQTPKLTTPVPTPKKAEQPTQQTASKPATVPQPAHKSPSPIQKQHRDLRGQNDYTPVKIAILNGKHNGAIVDLGLQPNEVGHDESYNWNPQESDGIRPGLNFKNIGNREISLTITYFDLNHDIAHLVENLKHIAEITDGEKTPPRLLYLQGDLRGVECVCTRFSDKYSDPLPGTKGYRKCEVSITLLLNGGLNNANSLGSPLTSTPLNDRAAKQTEADRQRRGLQSRIDLLLAGCLGAEGSTQLQNLIERNQQSDVQAIAQLTPNVFVQSAIAGIFPPELLQSERLKSKLNQDLALVLAQNTDGIANTPDVRSFATALASGDSAGLRSRIADQVRATQADFGLIKGAIEKQTLDESASLFDRNQNPTAASRMFALGGCGLDLRRNGASALSQTQQDDAKKPKQINQFFASKPGDDAIKTRFGVEQKSQIDAIKNGQPYQSKDQFIARIASNNSVSGYAAWANFSVE